jgi:hypothetical protein
LRWNNTKLVQQTQLVDVEPIFDDHTICDSSDQDGARGRLLPGGRNAHQVSLVRATASITNDHLIPFCDHILNRKAQIGKGAEIVAEELFGAFTVCRKSGRERVRNVVGGLQFVAAGQVVRVQELVEQPPSNRPVRLGEMHAFGHERASFRCILPRRRLTTRYAQAGKRQEEWMSRSDYP